LPHNFQRDQILNASTSLLTKGDLQGIFSNDVIKKARSEAINEKHGTLGMTDFEALSKKYKDQFIDNGEEKYLKIYIQGFGEPLYCVMYSKEQFKILSNLEDATLYFDATGSICGNMSLTRRLYYYAMVFSYRCQTIPIFELFATNHDNISIGNHLRAFKRNVETEWEVKWPPFGRVVTDMSWALMKALLSAFNNMTMITYLNDCYKCINERKYKSKLIRIHWCCAHYIKNVAALCKIETKILALKKLVCEVIASLCNLKDYDAIKEIYKQLFTLLVNKYINTATNQALLQITKLLDKYVWDVDIELEKDEKIINEDTTFVYHKEDGLVIYKESPSTRT